jgi:hypothetical protein
MINIEKHIKKILKEEVDFLRLMYRRLPYSKLQEIDDELRSSLNYISKIFIRNFKSESGKLSEKEFTRMVIVDMMTSLQLRVYLPDDIEWYEGIIDGLSKRYQERISSMYNVLKK